MLEKKFIKENLEKTICYKCGSSLGGAKLVPITEAPIALVAHAVCPKCQAESMVTITSSGSGSVPLMSDLSSEEIKRFINLKSIDYDELLDLHVALEKENIWKLLPKKEQKQEKNQKS